MLASLLLVIQGVYKDYFSKNGDSHGPVNNDEEDDGSEGPQGPQGIER